MKVVIDIPEIPKNDKQRWALANGTPLDNVAKEAIKEIREMCWAFDIPSPCCPEYREHHEQMQAIIGLCDSWLKKLEEGNEDCIYIGKDKYVRDADGQGWHVVEGFEQMEEGERE